ncbi:MAG: peptide ABC transporter substrate-binding protein [Anaerolineae bacterium]
MIALVLALFLLGAVIALRLSEPLPMPPQIAENTPAIRASTPIPTVTTAPEAAPTEPATAAPNPAASPIALPTLEPGVWREAVIAPECVLKLNPLLAGFNPMDQDVSSLIFEGLFKLDAYGSPVPALAAAPPRISADGLTYVISLRQDVLWQDGMPFTSADVAYTIGLLQSAQFSGPSDLYIFWRSVEFDALNANVVRFKLAQPLASFLDYLRIGILPAHALSGTHAADLTAHPFNLSPIGTGPYQFESLLTDGQHIRGVRLRASATFAARPEAQGKALIPQVEVICYPSFDAARAAYMRGEVNSISDVPPNAVQSLKNVPLTLYSAYKPALGAVIFNWNRENAPYFRDVRFRQALAKALDRNALIAEFMADRAVAADTPILPSSWAFARDVKCPAFDPSAPDAARNFLNQVQITPPPADPNATPPAPGGYAFQLMLPDDAALAALGQKIAEVWRGLGIQVESVVVDRATFRERLTAGTFDAALVELTFSPGADPDPYSVWRMLPRDGGLNFGNMNERRLSELVEAGRQTTNGIARATLYREFQKLFCDRAAAIVLYYPIYYYAADSRLAGVQFGFLSRASDRFRTVEDWQITAGESRLIP